MTVDAVLQGIGQVQAMLQNQAVTLNGVVQYCQALEQGQQLLLQGQSIIIYGQRVLMEEVLSLHTSTNNVFTVSCCGCLHCGSNVLLESGRGRSTSACHPIASNSRS